MSSLVSLMYLYCISNYPNRKLPLFPGRLWGFVSNDATIANCVSETDLISDDTNLQQALEDVKQIMDNSVRHVRGGDLKKGALMLMVDIYII